jgi:uncharacterized membrane protein
MARYRIGENPETGGDLLTQNIFIAAVVFGLVLGIGFTIAGFRGKQYWLAIWGAGLSICSVIYLFYVMLS